MKRIKALELAIAALDYGFDGEHFHKYEEAIQELEKMIKDLEERGN